jgi:5-methylcytosine-specific restriction protein A
MANRPKRPCRYPNCPELVESGYCERHKKEHNRSKRNSNEWVDLYNSTRWRKARKAFLNEHPLCAECARQSRLTTAKVVDHVQDHKGDLGLFWSEDNWEALCVTCHNRKTMLTNRPGCFKQN